MTQPLTGTDFYKLKTLSQPTANEKYVFTTQTYMDKATNGYRSNILAFNNNGEFVAYFDNNDYAAKNPTPAKDGLYFLSQTTPNQPYQLFYKSYQHQNVMQVTHFRNSVAALKVVPNTNDVYFTVCHTKEVPKKPYEQFPTVRHVTKAINKADGFGFYPNDGIYELNHFNFANSELTSVYSSKSSFKLSDVSSDGRLVSLVMANQHNPLDLSNGVYVLEVATNELNCVTKLHHNWNFIQGKFSPDTHKVLLVGQTDEYLANTQFSLYEYHLVTNKFTNLLKDADLEVHDYLFTDFTQNLNDEDAFWIDNEKLVFRVASHGRSQLFLYQHESFKLLYDENDRITDWSVFQDKLMVTYSNTTLPVELATIDLQGNKQSLFDPNQTFEKHHQFVKPQKFTFNASDGLPVEGWLMTPEMNVKSKLPLVLYVHGGPHFAYGENFFFEMQVHAAAGYGVVLLNPRGSKTYGQDFCQLNVGHYGEQDYSDLMEGMDYVLKTHPEFDEKRQYCAGGSFGGFMTTWVVGHTNRFAAAVAQRPVTNWVSFAGTSDIGFMFIPQEMLTDRYDVQKLWQASPLAYAKNVKTPTLIMQGEWDTRTPIGQGEEFFSALVENNVVTEMARYPQSWHGVSRDGLPNLRLQRIQETRNWWDDH